MSIKELLSRKLPGFFHIEDSYKDPTTGKGLLLRIIETLGEEVDDELVPKIENFLDVRDIDITDGKFLDHLAEFYGNPPDALGNNQYRTLLKYITALYKIKGTIKAFELYFSLLGFTIKIQEYWKENVRYDEFEFDTDAQYDEYCFGCSEYSIYFTDKDADCNNPSNSNIDLSTLHKLREIIYLNEPINARLRALVQTIKVCDEARLCHRETIGWTLSTRARYDDFTYDSGLRYDTYIVTDTGEVVDNNCLADLEWFMNELTDATAELNVSQLLQPELWWVERTNAAALLNTTLLVDGYVNFNEITNAVVSTEVTKFIGSAMQENTTATVGAVLTETPKAYYQENTDGSAVFGVGRPWEVDMVEGTDAAGILTQNSLVDMSTLFLETTQATASLLKTLPFEVHFIENTSSTGSIIKYATFDNNSHFIENTNHFASIRVERLLEIGSDMYEGTNASASIDNTSNLGVNFLEATDATGYFVLVKFPVVQFYEGTDGYAVLTQRDLITGDVNFLEQTNFDVSIELTRTLETNFYENTQSYGAIRGVNDTAAAFLEATDATVELIHIKHFNLQVNYDEETDSTAVARLTKLPRAEFVEQTVSPTVELIRIREQLAKSYMFENTFGIASLGQEQFFGISTLMEEPTTAQLVELRKVYYLIFEAAELTFAPTVELIKKSLQSIGVNYSELTDAQSIIGLLLLSHFQAIETTDASATLILNDLKVANVNYSEQTESSADIRFNFSNMSVLYEEPTTANEVRFTTFIDMQAVEDTGDTGVILNKTITRGVDYSEVTDSMGALLIGKLTPSSSAFDELTTATASATLTKFLSLNLQEQTDSSATAILNDLKLLEVLYEEPTNAQATVDLTKNPEANFIEHTLGRVSILTAIRPAHLNMTEVTTVTKGIAYIIYQGHWQMIEQTEATANLIKADLRNAEVIMEEPTTSNQVILRKVRRGYWEPVENTDATTELIVANYNPISSIFNESTTSFLVDMYKVLTPNTNLLEQTDSFADLIKHYEAEIGLAEYTNASANLIHNDLKEGAVSFNEATTGLAEKLRQIYYVGSSLQETTTQTATLIKKDLRAMNINFQELTEAELVDMYYILTGSLSASETTTATASLIKANLITGLANFGETTNAASVQPYFVINPGTTLAEDTDASAELIRAELITGDVNWEEVTNSNTPSPYYVIGMSMNPSEATGATAELIKKDLRAMAVNMLEITSGSTDAPYLIVQPVAQTFEENTNATGVLILNDLKQLFSSMSELTDAIRPSLYKVVTGGSTFSEDTNASAALIKADLYQPEAMMSELTGLANHPYLTQVYSLGIMMAETTGYNAIDLITAKLLIAEAVFNEVTGAHPISNILTYNRAVAMMEHTYTNSPTLTTAVGMNYHSFIFSLDPTFRYRMNLNGKDDGSGLHNNHADTEVQITYASSIIPNISSSESCAYFNGTNSEYNLPDHAKINVGTGYKGERFMYSFWIAADDVEPTSPQVVYEQGGTTNWIAFYIADGFLIFTVGVGGLTQVYTKVPIEAEFVYFVSGVLDFPNELMELFLDGQSVDIASTGSVGTSLPSHGGDIAIGATDGDVKDIADNVINGYYSGYLADLCIWAELTTGTQITMIEESDWENIYLEGIS